MQMKRSWWLYGMKFVLFAAVAVAAFGSAVMLLWNWLMPDVFGWRMIGFWQAAGLLVLSRILVGGLRGRGGHAGYWRARMKERWDQMSEEERARFRSGMWRRCGRSEPTSESTV
jgi:Ca2+/H+ antiporter, TMEM165/GDT1 family